MGTSNDHSIDVCNFSAQQDAIAGLERRLRALEEKRQELLEVEDKRSVLCFYLKCDQTFEYFQKVSAIKDFDVTSVLICNFQSQH